MGGRHRAGGGPRLGTAVKVLGALVVLALVAFLGVRWLTGSGQDCGAPVPLAVDVAPSLAPALTRFVREDLPRIDGEAQCLRPRIRAVAPAAVVEALSAPAEQPAPATSPAAPGAPSVPQESVPPRHGERPDVWIPDSTMWLHRAADAGAPVAERGTSVATSPVVLAVTERAARTAGWPAKPVRWASTLGAARTPGVVDPATDAGSLFALIGIEGLPWSTDRATRTVTTLSQITIPSTEDPFHRLPGEGGSPAATVFPVAEQQVVRHNATLGRGEAGSVVAAYPEVPTPWLDFPAAVRTDLDEARRAAGEAFRKALRSPAARAALAAHGFRGPDGRLGTEVAQDPRVRGEVGPVGLPPSRAEAEAALRQWATLSRLARVLVVLDVSGSMKAPVGKTGKSRMQVTLAAASKGLRLFRPGTQLSLWEFSTELDGKRDHREIAPYKPIIKHLAERLPQKLGKLVSRPQGATGLYDTVLAGYRQTMRTWDPAHLNLLVIFTDGRNEDAHGISRARLLGELGKLTDPARPAPVIFVGLGTDVDPHELRDISRATGGQTYLAPKVTDIQRIFFTALGKLACPGGRC